jgi:uncharacterized protein YerC
MASSGIVVTKESGFNAEVYLAWENVSIALNFVDSDDGWQEFQDLFTPDEADALADALKVKAAELRALWAGRKVYE